MKTHRLTFRHGKQIENPTPTDLKSAVDELSASDGEHPNTWLELGFDSDAGWSLISLDAYQSGLVIFEKWADQDDDDPELETRKQEVSPAEMVTLFELLLSEQLEELMGITTRWASS